MDSPIAVSLFTPTKDEIRDFSFYDQPEDMSAMTSPLASPLSESSTISRSSSVESLNSLDSEVDSSDEVFFGPVGTKERTLMAKLSGIDLEDSVRPNEMGSGKENSKRRVTRRDSREFHRRKTLVFSSRGSIANSPRPWGDGFFLKADKAVPSPLALEASITPMKASSTSPGSCRLSARQQSDPFLVEDDTTQAIESSSGRKQIKEEITLETSILQEATQLEDPEELESPDDRDLQDDFDQQSDGSDDEAAPEATPDTDAIETVTGENILSSGTVNEVEEPTETVVAVTETEEEAEEDPVPEPTEPEDVPLARAESQTDYKSLERDQLEMVDPAATIQDISALSITDPLPVIDTDTDLVTDGSEPSETEPDVTVGVSQADEKPSDTEDERVSRQSVRPEETFTEECPLALPEDIELSQSSEELSTEAEQTIQLAEESEAPLSLEEDCNPSEPDLKEDDTGSSEQTDLPVESIATPDEATAQAQEPTVKAPEAIVEFSAVPPPTPSMASEAGETTFDPESPMPVCRAPKPEVMMVYMSPDGRGADCDVIPFNRQLSLSPVAHIMNTASFNLGSFDFAKETMGSSTLRLRQAFSPDKRSMFSPKSGAPNTPTRTPSRTTDPPRSGFVQRSIALPPVTRVLDRTITKPDAPVQQSRNRDSSRKKAAPAKGEPSATDGGRRVDNDPFLAGPAATPMKSKRKSLRLMKNPTHDDRAPDIRVTSETRSNTPLRQPLVSEPEATPARPIASEIAGSTSSALPRVNQATESRLRQPSKSLLKKPSTSFLPVLKSSTSTIRPSAPMGNSSSAAGTSNNLSSSTSSTSSAFDFVQPVPPSKITSFMTSVKSRPIMPMPMKSPAKQPDVFSSGLGAPVRPNRAPIVSTSTGPPVRPNMTPMRNGIRSFGSPVRSNLSPIKNPLFGTPQRSQMMATPLRSYGGMDSPQVALNRSRARPLVSSLAERKAASTLSNENTLPGPLNTGLTGSVKSAGIPICEEAPIAVVASAPVRQDEPTATPAVPPSKPLEIAGSLVSAMANDASATAGTSRRSLRPARAAVNLASSATSEAVKPSKAASKRDKVKPSAPPAVKAINVDVESITKLNTARNEVVFSAITTVKQRRQGERPRGDPLTVAEKIAALSREERAVRRQLERSGMCSESEGESSRPTDSHRRGAGETEDYTTPARPTKRAREESESPTRAGPQKKSRYESVMLAQTSVKEERRVKWDKGLIMISDSRNAPSECSSLSQAVKSCLKKTVILDHLGNVPNANLGAPGLQPLPVEVFKIRYDGEDFSDGEPGETKANKRAEKGKGRKKAVATSEK